MTSWGKETTGEVNDEENSNPRRKGSRRSGTDQ